MKFLNSIKSWFQSVWRKLTAKKKVSEQPESSYGVNTEVQAGADTETSLKKSPKVQSGFNATVKTICYWVFKLRSVFMAIPVLVTAIIFAFRNNIRLPEKIAVYFPSFEADKVIVKLTELDRGAAVAIPFLITLACLALMFCSRRTVYPWIISIFSLVLPWFFYFIGMYPV